MKLPISIIFCLVAGLTLSSFELRESHLDGPSKDFKKKFSLVIAGSIFVSGTDIPVKEFYVSKLEVTNAEYNEFVHDIISSGNNDLLEKIKVENNLWETVCNSKFLALEYNTSPSYSQHPVVNISYEGAVEYCKWMTEKANHASKKGWVYEYRLPSRVQWIRAAEGNFQMVDYAWGRFGPINSKGCLLCQCNGTTEPKTDIDLHTYTCKADAYFPNSIGLYNMNGNAAEMIDQKGIAVGGSWASPDTDVKNSSMMKYDGPSPMIGFRPIVLMHKNGK